MTDDVARPGGWLAGFAPDPARARLLDAGRHEDLAESLAYLAEVLAPARASLSRVVCRLRAGERLPPHAFGTYFRLAELALAGERDEAAALAVSLSDVPAAARNLTLSRWGEAEAADLVALLCAQDPGAAARFGDVSEDQRLVFRQRLDAGLDLLATEVPDLHGEITAMVRQVLLARPPEGAEIVFDGASHYQFWGLLMLNAERHTTAVGLAEALAHESGHSLLFGLTTTEPLVFNPDEELFSSPLRADPRPMDGIFHATFVSARMAWTMERLAQSKRLSPEERAAARAAAERDRGNFHKGQAVIALHARLSPTGAEIMDNAAKWIGR